MTKNNKDKIKEQEEFVSWLKSKGMYNPHASPQVMQFGHDVWKAMKDR